MTARDTKKKLAGGERRTTLSKDGVLVVRSGPADQATEEAIERWLLSLLDARRKAVR